MLPASGEWLATQAMHAPFWAVITATMLWFTLIYA